MKTSSRLLRGKVAVVSGGAGDIGRAIARRLRAAGAKVALGDVVPVKTAKSRLRGYHYTEVDVTDTAALELWLDRVTHDLGLPDIIVPNAGVVEIGSPLQIGGEAWQRTLDINLTGAFGFAQLAARRLMREKRTGRIVFIGSWAAHAPHPQIIAYCAAKAGLRMAMQCLALELAPHGILVNEVAPGKVDAGLSRKLFDATPGLRERTLGDVPTRTLLDPEDVARGVEYLCSPENAQTTGSVLLLDGGLSLVRPV